MSISELLSNPDFQLNLIAESFGVVAETIIVYLVISRVLASRERKRWRPARLNVAKKTVEVQRNLFNTLRRMIDPDFHISKTDHNLPESMSQQEANHWGRSYIIKPNEGSLNALKKMVEYNNSALDSVLMPLMSDFLIASEQIITTTKHMYEANNPNSTYGNSVYMTTIPSDELKTMEDICEEIVRNYPEIEKSDFEVLAAEEIVSLFKKAADRNPKIGIIESPKPTNS